MKAAFLLTALMLLLWYAPAAQAESSCGFQEVTDPAGDVSGEPVTGPIGSPDTVDLLGLRMEHTEAGLAFNVTLAADPRDQDDSINYYWVSIEADFETTHGNPPTWTIQRSATYDSISSMYYEVDSDYAVTWTGASFGFLVPWAAFEAEYGDAWPVDIGSPRASVSGPYLGIAGVYEEVPPGRGDWAEFASELVPLAPCPAQEDPPVVPASTETGGSQSGTSTASQGPTSSPTQGAQPKSQSTATLTGSPASMPSGSPGAVAAKASPAPLLVATLALLLVTLLRKR